MNRVLDYLPNDASSKEAAEAGCVNCKGIVRVTLENVYDTRFGIDCQWSAAICGTCGLEQIFPVPKADKLNDYYEQYYNFGGSGRGPYERLRGTFSHSYFYRLWMVFDGDIAFYS